VAPVFDDIAAVEREKQRRYFAFILIPSRNMTHHRLPFAICERSLVTEGDELEAVPDPWTKALDSLLKRRMSQRQQRFR
jgi:hypothetical protein